MVVHQFCKLRVVGSSPTQGSLYGGVVKIHITLHFVQEFLVGVQVPPSLILG